MGLLDFAKDIGHALFGDDEAEAADSIKAHILADNPGIDNLSVTYQKGFVTLEGNSGTWDAVEKAVLMAGNVKGVGRVISNIAVAEDTRAAPTELGGSSPGQYYEIQSGDTLSAIARKFLGDASLYPKIFAANREVIRDPDRIFPGQKIRIPG